MHALPLHLVANERPLINVDATLVVNILLWIVLYLMLKPLLWEPLLALITAREAGTAGARKQAEELLAEAKRIEGEYEASLRKVRSEGTAERDGFIAAAAAKEADLLATARNEAAQILENRRVSLGKTQDELRTELQKTIPELAASIASRVLGREVRSS